MSNQIRQALAGLLAVTLLLQGLPFPAYAQKKMAAVQSTGETTQPTEETTQPTKGAAHLPEGAVHPTEGTVPSTEGIVPSTEGTIPSTEGTIPSAEETVPSTEGTIPSTEETVPSTEETVPSTEEQLELTSVAAGGKITVNTAADLVNLSNMDAAEYQNADITIARNGTLTLGDDFQGLGSAEYPFMGTVEVVNGTSSAISISLSSPFFNYLDQQATIKTGFRLKATGSGQDPLLTKYYVNSGAATDPGKVSLTVEASGETGVSFGGLIGQMGDRTKLMLTVQNSLDSGFSIKSSDNLGFFCNTMGNGAELTLTVSGETTLPDITSTGGNAGGLVGEMRAGAKLTVNSSMTVAKVTSGRGNAGGLVGRATQPTIDLKAAITLSDRIQGVYIFDDDIRSAADTVGGYIGCAAYTENTILDLSNLRYANLTLTGGNHTGGVFGVLNLDNTNGKTLTIKNAKTAFSHDDGSWQLGGIIGQYSANSAKSVLRLEAPEADIVRGSATALGGILGLVADKDKNMALSNATAAYVEISNAYVSVKDASCEYFGGMAAEMDKAGHILFVSGGTVTGTGYGTSGIGGILGQGKGGFLRLSGETNLSGFTFAQTGIGCGQIAGEIDGTVVYAMGSGSGGEGDYNWNFRRPASAPVSDVGSYGEVIRLNAANLKEGKADTTDDNVLFYVNHKEHTIELPATVNFANIATKRDLAALAIGMQRGDVPLDTGITLTADIDLTGTGIYALLRDDGSQTYTGTFDGDGHTLRIAAGEAYGAAQDEIGSGQIYNHSTVGWIPGCNGTVENLTLAGTIALGNVVGGTAVNCGGLAGKTEGMSANTVTVNTAIDIHDTGDGNYPDVYAGGFLGYSETGELNFTECTMQGSIRRTTGNHSFDIGGFAGRLKYTSNTNVTFRSCKLAGTGAANRPNVDFISTTNASLARIGGLISHAQNASITVDDLTVEGFQMKSTGTTKSGGLFGSSWTRTNVTVTGSKIKDSTLDCGSSRFGGLVFSASGYWKVGNGTTAGITFQGSNAFTGKTGSGAPSALMIAETTDTSDRTYLEILCDGLQFDSAPTVTLDGGDFFDDLVGKSKYGESNNSVVSIGLTAPNADAPVLIDTDSCNTWENQCSVNGAKTYTNGQTRYYYNVDYYRAKGLGNDAAGDFLLWSLKQYAGSNISDKFSGQIAGNIDLTGVSYYPVPIAPGSNNLTLDIENATVTFDYTGMNDKENNRKFDSSNLQHYQMHTGILSTVTASADRTVTLNVTNLKLKGTFGRYTDNSAGALICSGVISKGVKASVTAQDITLDGIYCANTADEPLLIHAIDSMVDLTLVNVVTNHYTPGTKVATALIGAVGGKDAEAINLTFSKMGLEGDRGKSIFSKATFAESFLVKTDGKASSGTYNFEQKETLVTYGKEISNGKFETVWNRNSYDGSGAGQVWYYDTFGGDIYVSPAGGASTPYNFSGYLPYIGVYEHVDGTSTYRELDVNQQIVILIDGCGTYGHPWEITEAAQLMAAARILDGNNSGIALKIAPDALTAKWTGQNTSISYIHDSASQKANEDMVLVYSGSGWKQAQVDENGHYAAVSGGKDYSADQILAYVRNGYYQICKDMTLDMSQFSGLGGNDWDCKQAFSGVIVGKANDSGSYPTVTLTGKNPTGQVGGLIRYSQGSVVKDLNIKFQYVEIAVNNANGIRTDKTFFGGVIGLVKGGDNIIDHVTVSDNVTVSDSGVKITGNETQLTAVGGYVGVVGGNASSAKKNGSYVNSDIRNGGGVVFRNISGNRLQSIKNDDEKYYWNPYIGRVLDGYACAEASCGDLNNTDKNYKIPTLSDEKLEIMPGNKDPKNGVDLYPNSTVKIDNKQDIWLLSAIVNSGFGGKTVDTRYSDSTVDYLVRASYYGRVRTGSYAGVGTAQCDAMEDEKDYWGGATGGTHKNHSASYLSTYVTTGVGSTVPAKDVVDSLSVAMGGRTIQFAGKEYNMTCYGNGFRGIGRGYMELTEYQVRRIGFIQLSKVTGLQGTDGNYPVIKYQRTLNDYGSSIDLHEPAAGFFSMVYGNGSNAVTVENLIFEGSVTRAKVSTDQASGVVIGKTSFAKTKINFTNVTVQNSSITSAVYGAGLLAYSDQTVSFTVQNCQVGSSAADKGLETDEVNHAGGFLGYVANKTDTQVTFTNCAAVKTALNNVQYGGLYAGQILVPCTVTGGSAGAEDDTSSITEIDGNAGARRLGGLIGNAGSTLTVNAETPNANPITPVTIRNIRINSSKGTSTSSSIGGVAGYSAGTADIQNVSVQDVTLVGKNMGGILGQAAGGAKMKNVSVCNSTLANCQTDNIQGRNTGGLIGELSGGSFTGFQLLSRNNLIGYLVGSTKTENQNLGSFDGDFTKLIPDYIGLSTASNKYTPYNGNISTVALDAPCGIWVGNANNKEVRLVAASRIGEYSPVKNYRSGEGGKYTYGSDVIYADYTGAANGDASKAGTMPAVPGLSPLPNTGDGLSITSRTGIIDDTIENSLMKGYFGANPDRPLDDIVKKFATGDETGRVRTYKEELLDLYTGEDFPVLVLNATNELNKIVDDYISLLTNRDETTTGRGHMYDKIVPDTYRYEDGAWNLYSEPTATWDSTRKNLKVSSKYDNQPGVCQVTVLDVQYKNPSEGSNDLYHLYIPVYVKKVMDVYFDVKMANGAAGYDGAYSDTSVLANFGEYFTADLTFTYRWSREEWSYLLESGQNLLWNYSKTIQLAELNTAADTEIFNRAHMTLVDGNTRADTASTAYLSKDNLTIEDRTVSLALDGTKIPDLHYLCDLLPLKTDPSGNRYKVVNADSQDATVRIWENGKYVYYAPKTAEDPDEATDCDITLEDTQENTLEIREQYYLVMYFEPSGAQERYNWEMKLSGTPSGQIPLLVKERDTNIYVLGNYFQVGELTLQTVSKTGEPQMKLDSNDTITVTMTSTASVPGGDVAGLNGYIQGRDLYYQYAVHLLDQDGKPVKLGGTVSPVGVKLGGTNLENTDGSPGYTMTLTENTCYINVKAPGSEFINQTFEVQLQFAYEDAGALASQFPLRTNAEGVHFAVDTRVGYLREGLEGSSMKDSKVNNTLYYMVQSANAKLTYDAYNTGRPGGTSQEDWDGNTSQLGLNAREAGNSILHTRGQYDVRSYLSLNLQDEESENYPRYLIATLSLERKNDNGAYVPVEIDRYLEEFNINNEKASKVGGSVQVCLPLSAETVRNLRTNPAQMNIYYTVKPGDQVGWEEFQYANYKVKLSAYLTHDKEATQRLTQPAEDYLIYTHTKVYLGIVNVVKN